MKAFTLLLVVLALVLPVVQPARADGYAVRAVSDFYEPLGALGDWVEVTGYGWCWQPRGVDADWRPYAEGHWLWSDAGWYWASEEPWAWACYHYGRWMWTADYGWLWVPGTEWAPAWVTWRDAGDMVGWAPLPPPTVVIERVCVPPVFVFVEVKNFCRPVRRPCAPTDKKFYKRPNPTDGRPTSVVRAPTALSTSRPMLPIASPGMPASNVYRRDLDPMAGRRNVWARAK